jgi:DNA-binding NtrC family response regulator
VKKTQNEARDERGLIGQSKAIGELRRLIRKAAESRLPVLLLGETGTGKEVVARAIYGSAPSGQFVPIDCGSLVGTLMESELFGHVKGAFSGAVENKKGLVALANGGTTFFDEIGDLPLEMQVKLLRLIQEREFRAVGALRWDKVDLRIVAATHRNLKAEVAAGRFRQDLFYRLNVFAIHLPPLRERKEDIPLLVDHFLNGSDFHPGAETMASLLSYDWPGNVRELKHCVERMAALQSDGVVHMADMPSALQGHLSAASLQSLSVAVSGDAIPHVNLAPRPPVISLPETEKQAIVGALMATGGERAKAARLLGIGRTTLYRKMKEYGFD